MICTMSKEFAEKKGYHDALMLDHRNYVAEGTGANIFFIKGNKIDTPIADCFLNGITRQAVIDMLKKQDLFSIEEYFEINIPFNANDPAASEFDVSKVKTIINAIEELVSAKDN